MKIKTYNIASTKAMYQNYTCASDKEGYINGFIKREKDNGITTKEDFFSLLLSEAIKQQDPELVKDILNNNSKDSYPSLLTNANKNQMSPLAFALLHDYSDKEGTIITTLKDYLNQGSYFQKVYLTKNAFLELKNAVGYQGDLYLECIDELIKPICVESQVSALGDFSISVDSMVFN